MTRDVEPDAEMEYGPPALSKRKEPYVLPAKVEDGTSAGPPRYVKVLPGDSVAFDSGVDIPEVV
jgi:hypothetical protein